MFLINSYGGEKQENTAKEIKILLKKIKSAPPEEKYKYMNELKKIIRKLHKKEREKLIKELLKQKTKSNEMNQIHTEKQFDKTEHLNGEHEKHFHKEKFEKERHR